MEKSLCIVYWKMGNKLTVVYKFIVKVNTLALECFSTLCPMGYPSFALKRLSMQCLLLSLFSCYSYLGTHLGTAFIHNTLIPLPWGECR